MPDVIVVAGAGASWNAPPEGFGSPPLTYRLFDAEFDELRSRYPALDSLAGTILARALGAALWNKS